jgi:hypothetical protein
MKTGTKTILIILITLIIGMIIGALVTGVFARHRVRRFRSMREPGHLVARIERIIGPDESQREAVREILREHSEQFLEIHSQFEGEMLALRDSLKKDLDPLLTDEQKARLERGPRHQGPFEGKGKRPGPPFGGKGRRPGPSKWREPGHQPPANELGPPPPPERDEG